MKLGLGQSYDSVEYLPRKIRAYIDLTKPASSVGVGGGYLVASLFYFAYANGGGSIVETQQQLFSIIYVSLTMFLAHSASQALNMAEDAEMDRHTPHKQNRPIPSGVVSEEEARSLAWILSAFALGRAFMVNWRFGVFVTVLLFMGIFYNLAPVRAKSRIISIPWQAVARGLLVFPTVWAAYGNPFAVEAWSLGVFLFFYVLAFQNSADIIDRHVDREYGIKTFIVVFGVEKTIHVMIVSVAFMAITLGLMLNLEILPARYGWLAIVLFPCIYMLWKMENEPYEVSDTTGNHPVWLWYYGGLVSIITVPLLIEVLV